MKKILIHIIFIITLISPAVADDIKVSIIGDRLTIDASKVPLQRVLQSLVAYGIKVSIDPDINPRITASFNDREIQKGLYSLLKPLNYILIWKSIDGPVGTLEKLEEIHVFKPGEKGLIRPLATSGSGRVIEKGPKGDILFIKNEILLGLKPGVSISVFRDILKRIGGTVIDSNASIGIYKILLPENSDVLALLNEISDYQGIAKAEPNYAYPVTSPYRNPDFIGAATEEFPSISPQEGAAPVAVIDTGLTSGSGLEEYILASLDALNPEEPLSDPLGHGTQMALIAAGIVKPYGTRRDEETLSPIIPIKAFDDDGYVSNFDIMESIDFALKNGARVMSLSWGSEIKSDFLESSLHRAASKGLYIVASAGNEPTGRPVYPAAYKSVIGVGALQPDGKRWENSNFGDFVMVYAPGFASLPVGYKGDPGTYAGTSISTAFVANLIANHLSDNPDATIKEVFKALAAH